MSQGLDQLAQILKGINDLIEKMVMALGMAIIAFAVVVMTGGAITRYYSGMGYDWVMDLPPIMMPWLFFLMCGALFRSGSHITVDFLPYYLSERGKCWLRFFVHLVVLAATSVFLTAGIEAVALFRKLGQVIELEFDLPIWYIYLSFPVGFAILVSFTLELVLSDLVELGSSDHSTLSPNNP